MQIEDVKPWMWAVIGVVCGLLFSLSLRMSGPWFDSDQLDTTDTPGLEVALQGIVLRHGEPALVRQFHDGLPLIRDLVVHPPFNGDPTPGRYWVTGQMYHVGPRYKDPKKPAAGMVYAEWWAPFKLPTSAPFVSKSGLAPGKYPTVMEYLDAAQQAVVKDQHLAETTAKASPPPAKPAAGRRQPATPAVAKVVPFPAYRFAWPERPTALWALPATAGLLLIGIAWPTTLGAMRSVGLARNPAPKVKRAKPAPVEPMRPTPSTAGVRVVLPPSAVAKAADAAGDKKQYGGEFYPVVKQAHHD